MKEILTYIAAFVIVFVLGIAGVIGKSYMESKTFNKLTGANSTWFDALWVEMRVVEPVVID